MPIRACLIKHMENNPGMSLIELCRRERADILPFEEKILNLKQHSDLKKEVEGSNAGEAIANIMLAYRHLEDARMRLGKVIQAMDGGTSVYDKPVINN